MNRENVKQRVKFSIIIIIISIVISFAIFTVLKYEVEGERNMPFELGKIIVISSAVTTHNIEDTNEKNEENVQNVDVSNSETTNSTQSSEKTNENYMWNEKVVQTNDVYIYIDKNKDFKKEEIIKSVRIDNIQILKNVKIGKLQIYMPNSLDDGVYKYVNEYLVNSTLTYKGAVADNRKNLEIGNQGGCVCISFANIGIGEYKSNEDTEIQQGAYILEKMNVANEDLKCTVGFDIIIEVQNKCYKANVKLDLPAAQEIVGKKETHTEITNFDDVIFKRM